MRTELVYAPRQPSAIGESRMKALSLQDSRAIFLCFLCLFPVAFCYGQQNGLRLPMEISPQATPSIEVQALFGAWGAADAANPFVSYELRANGTCEAKIYYLTGSRSYVHDGNFIRFESNAPSQPELVWSAQIEGNYLILKFSEDLPACPFHRIEGGGSAIDPLVGTWAAEKCGVEDWKPASLKLRMQASNALYAFSDNHIMYGRSRLEDVQPFTVKEDTIVCPVFGMPANSLRLTSRDGVPTLISLGFSRAYVRISPGDIAFHQYNPGDISKDNVDLARKACDYFTSQLATDPSDVTTLDKLGSLLFQMAGYPFDKSKFEESKTYYKRHISLRPNDADPHYMLGVIDWALAYHGNREMRRDYNMAHLSSQVRDIEPLPLSVQKEYGSDFSQVVNEGIDNLKKTLSLRPNDDYAFAYLSLSYRLKADMAESGAERTNLLKEADNLLAQSVSLKQANAAVGDLRLSQYPGIAPPPPPAPSTSQVATVTRIAVGGSAQAGHLINRVQPVYPPLARQTRVQGTVRLHAILNTDGTVQELKVIEGHPLLIQAAIAAAQQWRYQPTMVNGRPAEVDTEIDVIFSLAQ